MFFLFFCVQWVFLIETTFPAHAGLKFSVISPGRRLLNIVGLPGEPNAYLGVFRFRGQFLHASVEGRDRCSGVFRTADARAAPHGAENGRARSADLGGYRKICARVSLDVSSQGSLSKVSNVETSQLESTRLGTWFLPLLPTRLETWNCRVVYLDLSRGMKVNEFADLTTSEFVFEYTEEKPNIVWTGRTHLETHEYVDEPLDQVKPDSCFQSIDEGPSLFFFLYT